MEEQKMGQPADNAESVRIHKAASCKYWFMQGPQIAFYSQGGNPLVGWINWIQNPCTGIAAMEALQSITKGQITKEFVGGWRGMRSQ